MLGIRERKGGSVTCLKSMPVMILLWRRRIRVPYNLNLGPPRHVHKPSSRTMGLDFRIPNLYPHALNPFARLQQQTLDTRYRIQDGSSTGTPKIPNLEIPNLHPTLRVCLMFNLQFVDLRYLLSELGRGCAWFLIPVSVPILLCIGLRSFCALFDSLKWWEWHK